MFDGSNKMTASTSCVNRGRPRTDTAAAPITAPGTFWEFSHAVRFLRTSRRCRTWLCSLTLQTLFQSQPTLSDLDDFVGKLPIPTGLFRRCHQPGQLSKL